MLSVIRFKRPSLSFAEIASDLKRNNNLSSAFSYDSVIGAEIVEDLEAALQQFTAIANDLKH